MGGSPSAASGRAQWLEGDLSPALSYTNLLLIVRAESFEASSPLYIERGEWRIMWEQCLRAEGRRIVDIRLAENPAEVAKYVTKPSAYLKFHGDGAWWSDRERLESLHYAQGSRRLIAWSRSLSEIRPKLGFLEDDEFDDLVAVGQFDDGEAWVPSGGPVALASQRGRSARLSAVVDQANHGARPRRVRPRGELVGLGGRRGS